MSIPEELMQEELEAQAEVRPEMTEGEILKSIDEEIRWASDLLQDDISANRTRAWEYFKGTSPKVIDEDVSEYFQTVVSRDVADAIEATLAEILPAFASERPAEFDPIGPGDEDQAALESDICNDILMEEGSGYLEFATAAKNAFLLRIGAIEVIAEELEEVEFQETDIDPESLAMLLQQDPGIEVREMEASEVVDFETGEAMQSMHVQLKITRQTQRIRTEAVPVDELLISSDSTSLDLERARFVARDTLVSRSDLIAMGYDRDIVEHLTPYTTTTSERSRAARRRNTWGREKHSGDPAMDLIRVVRCYYRLDEDRDGIAERREIVVGGTPGGWRLLSDLPVEYQPFAAGAAYIWPHQPHGVSLYDKLGWVQDVRTKFLRIMLEAGQRSSRDRVGLLPGTDLDDWQATQFGGGIRMQSPNGLVPIPNPSFPSELSMLDDMLTRARREGGGGSIDKANSESMPVEAGAHGVERMLSAIEELNAGVARMLAETLVKQSYLILHKVLRLYSPPLTRRVGGQWITEDPSQWQPRDKISMATGLTMSERGRQAAALGNIVQKQTELLQTGSPLANPQTLYRAMMDQARMLGIGNAEAYYVDPSSEEGMAAQQAQQESAQQAEQQAQEMQAQQAQLQAQSLAMVEQVRGQLRLQAEREKTAAGMTEAMSRLQEDQRQFNETLAQQYDELRLKLVEIEAKYGEQNEQPIQREQPEIQNEEQGDLG